MELKQKGAKADIGSFKQMKVALIWTSPVDLDLMAFYKTKDGRVGGVYSENYSGGYHGDLNQFPFIQLSGDEGVGAVAGSKQEDMRIVRLDDYEELFICALNFTDVSSGANNVFANYDAKVQVSTDKGETHTVALDSGQPGSVAVICKFSSGFIASSLINSSEVMTFDEFRSKIPGADQLKIASKITLKTKGDSFAIKQKAQKGDILINLNWNQNPQGGKGFLAKLVGGGKGIDLDLGCLFEMRNGTIGAIQPLGNSLGSFDSPPYILHCGDDRTGSWSEGENMRINLTRIGDLKRVLIYTYIYEGVPKWSDTDGIVTITVPGQPVIEVPMGAQSDSRPFCAIAMLEMSGGNIQITRLISFHQGHEDCDRTYSWGLRWVAGSKD
jgi:uncharacterized protein involved in tellurium resistance